MIVTVRLFARAKELAKADEVRVEVAESATVGELRRRLAELAPALDGLLARCRIAVDAEFADDATALRESSEVALIPPVSGG